MNEVNYNNLAIIIVTYNPESNLEILLSKCNKISSQIIVVDNNSSNKDWVREISKSVGATCIANSDNLGIGKAINVAISQIDRKHVQYVVTFDQDSLPPDDLLESYNYVLKRENNVGLIGINFNQIIQQGIPNSYDYKESLDQITSGLLHNTEIFDAIGGYNERLFIDCVDFEYSLRVKKYGFKTIMISNCFLKHTIGNPKIITLGLIKIQSMNHSAFRQYYIIRNHIWLAKKYFSSFPLYFFNKFYHLFIRVTKTVLIDDDKKNKIIQISKGINDGFRFNMD